MPSRVGVKEVGLFSLQVSFVMGKDSDPLIPLHPVITDPLDKPGRSGKMMVGYDHRNSQLIWEALARLLFLG